MCVYIYVYVIIFIMYLLILNCILIIVGVFIYEKKYVDIYFKSEYWVFFFYNKIVKIY